MTTLFHVLPKNEWWYTKAWDSIQTGECIFQMHYTCEWNAFTSLGDWVHEHIHSKQNYNLNLSVTHHKPLLIINLILKQGITQRGYFKVITPHWADISTGTCFWVTSPDRTHILPGRIYSRKSSPELDTISCAIALAKYLWNEPKRSKEQYGFVP